SVAGRGRRLVRHDLDSDAARHRVVEAGRGGTRAGFDLAGAERRYHVGRRAEIDDFDLEAFLAEIALLVRDEDGRVARAAGRADCDGLRGRRARRRQECAQECTPECAGENCGRAPLVQTRSSGSFLFWLNIEAAMPSWPPTGPRTHP